MHLRKIFYAWLTRYSRKLNNCHEAVNIALDHLAIPPLRVLNQEFLNGFKDTHKYALRFDRTTGKILECSPLPTTSWGSHDERLRRRRDSCRAGSWARHRCGRCRSRSSTRGLSRHLVKLMQIKKIVCRGSLTSIYHFASIAIRLVTSAGQGHKCTHEDNP